MSVTVTEPAAAPPVAIAFSGGTDVSTPALALHTFTLDLVDGPPASSRPAVVLASRELSGDLLRRVDDEQAEHRADERRCASPTVPAGMMSGRGNSLAWARSTSLRPSRVPLTRVSTRTPEAGRDQLVDR